MTQRSLKQIEQSLRTKLAEDSVMDEPYSRDMRDPEYRKWLEKAQALQPDPVSQMFTPGVSSAQDIGDVAAGDLGAAPFAALGMVPVVGGPASKIVKKIVGRGERGAPQVWRRGGEPIAPPAGPKAPPGPDVWRRGEAPPASAVPGPGSQVGKTPKTKLGEPIDLAKELEKSEKLAQTRQELERKLRGQDFKPGKPTPGPELEPTPFEPKTNLGRAEPGFGPDTPAPRLDGPFKPDSKIPKLIGQLATGAGAVGAVVAAPTAIEKYQDYMLQSEAERRAAQRAADKEKSVDEAQEAPNYTREQFLTWAKQAADRYQVPLPLVLHAMHTETAWMKNPNKEAVATSPKGARGVMQLMPQYAKDFGIDKKDLTDPEKNIDAGTRLLAKLFNQYKDPKLALAAYNAGPNGKRFKAFVQTGNPNVLGKETKSYITGYQDDVKSQLEKFFPRDKNKVAQVATDILATTVGAGSAKASDEIPPKSTRKVKKEKIAVSPEPVAPVKVTDVEKTSVTPSQTIKLTPDEAKKLPPVELFGHIFPGLELNKSGGIGGVGTKPYTMPDGTVITDKRTLDKIRELQSRPAPAPAANAAVKPAAVAEPSAVPAKVVAPVGDEDEAAAEKRMQAQGDVWREKQAAVKAQAKADVTDQLQKDQKGIGTAYKGSAAAQAIMQQNPDIIKDVNTIKTGSTIKVGGEPYVVQPGDTLDKIAKKAEIITSPEVPVVKPVTVIKPEKSSTERAALDNWEKLAKQEAERQRDMELERTKIEPVTTIKPPVVEPIAKSDWDKFITGITGKEPIDPRDTRIQIPESINIQHSNALDEILKLAGRK